MIFNKHHLRKDVLLENERVLLVPFYDNRNAALKNIIFDDAIWMYMGMHMRTADDFENYIVETIEQQKKGISCPFLIIDKLTGKVAGSTRYGNINLLSEKCEIGWTWYGKEYQGTGLNKACKYELLKYAFETIGFRRIQFSADIENIGSQKAIAKLGAKKEGVFRHNYVDAKDNSRDDVYFSILKEEWYDLKKTHFSEF